MATTRFITYYIVLADPVLVAQYQAQFPYGYGYAPATGAAVAFAAPWAGSFPGTDPNHVPSSTYFGPAPYTWSPEWISANNYDATVATFERHSGGFWGIGGSTVRYYWLGQFVLAEPAVPTVNHIPPPAPAASVKVYMLEGFEFGDAGTSGIARVQGVNYSRDASRHVGGMGLALRGPNTTMSVNMNNFRAPLTFRTWERFYIRLRLPDPSATVAFWRCKGSADGTGFTLGITPSGQMSLSSINGPTTLLGTTAVIPAWTGAATDDAWHKIDVLVRFNPNEAGPPVINTAKISVYMDGALALQFTSAAAAFGSQFHGATDLGSPAAGTFLQMDMDDWAVMDWPLPAEPLGPALTGTDWLSGMKIVRARPKQFSVNHSVNWVGGLQTVLENPMETGGNLTTITSTTAGAIAEVDLDIASLAKDPGMKGVAAFVIAVIGGSNTSGTVGYSLNGGAQVPSTFSESAGSISLSNSYTGAFNRAFTKSMHDQPALTSLAVRHTKAADANQGRLSLLDAQIALIGMWTKADYRATESGATPPVFPRWVGQHNAPYPFSIYAKGTAAPPPNSPVIITSGTYVGNGTGQDINFRAPIHFLFIRPTTGDIGGYKWWPSMLNGHRAAHIAGASYVHFDYDQTFVPGLGVDVQQERYRMRLSGNDSQVNANGVTYQYVAVSDPGARFMLCGAMYNKSTLAANVYPLVDPTFTPEAMLLFRETADTTGGSGMMMKGLGTPVDAIYNWGAIAQSAAAITFGAGSLSTTAILHALTADVNMPFILFRRADGNADPGQPGVMALLNWTGDGTASRTIGIAPASGKRPIFAIVASDNASTGSYRDPSHPTTHSSADAGVDQTTGITGGGIDSLSVGILLNANGINYTALVLLGGVTAGNGGFGVDGEYIPVEAAPPVGGPGPFPTIDQVNPPTPPPTPISGEPDLDAVTVLSDAATGIGGLVGGQTCEYYTRHVVNMSLSRIGISKRILNLATDDSQEATLARSHVLEDVNQVLRDFPWGFAKRYANLVLVGGTSTVPINADWQYSYRAPAAMMKARRVANKNMIQKRYDPNPPRFEISADSVGPLIYTNEVATTASTLVLEYTVRSLCPALYGDALFRDALAWKFAWSLAPVLSKDTKKQDYCRAMYALAISKAETANAQEQQQAKAGDADWINDREFGPGAQPNMWPWGER